jgi:tyrosinase
MHTRQFRPTALLLTTLISLVTPELAEAADTVRIRRSAGELTPADQQIFVDAMYAMKAAPARGDGRLAANRYDEYVQFHSLFRLHMNSGFLPWHRKMLWEFETEIRQLDPVKFGNFTLPYWNWGWDLFPETLVGPGGDPINRLIVTQGPFAAGLWSTVNPSPSSQTQALERTITDELINMSYMTPEAIIMLIFRERDYEGFSMNLEMRFHNYAHNSVGGQFATIAGAVDDPFFWLLHSWVDMLWARWQTLTGSTTADDYMMFEGGPGLDERMSGFGDSSDLTNIGFDTTMFNTARDQLDPLNMTTLGYNYEYLGNLVLPPVVIPEPESLVFATISVAAIAGLACMRRERRRA